MVTARKHERLGYRYGRLVGAIFFVLAVCLLAVFVLLRVQGPLFRQTAVLVNDPMVVFSWDGRHKNLTLITIPADTTISGVHGAGFYTLDALWQLGRIDSRQRLLLMQSLEDSLGLPISWYIHGATLKQTFSFGNTIAYLKGDYSTNVPPWLFFSWSWAFGGLRPDKITTISLESARSDVPMPDGTVSKILDLDRTDVLLSNIFEDERLRAEAIRTEVLNTTGTPTLGGRIGRLLGHMGVSVVSVGNDSPPLAQCELSGSKISLTSLTALFIEGQYHCEKKEIGETRVADLVLRIGRDLEEYFTQTTAPLR